MKVALYFGSFNPVHVGHLIIASHILNETDVQKLWFVVSPQNPFKQSASLLNEYDRLYLLQKAIETDARMKAVDIEFNLPKPSYTSVTLAYLQEKFPNYEFVIVMGGDSYQNLHKWKNAEFILSNYEIFVYNRPGYSVANTNTGKVKVLDAPLLQISATHIRHLIKDGKSIKYLVPAEVEAEIIQSRFYKSIKSNQEAGK